MYKLIVLDMDGILFIIDKKVLEKIKVVLKVVEEKGVKVVLVLGRFLDGLIRYLEEFDLFKG